MLQQRVQISCFCCCRVCVCPCVLEKMSQSSQDFLSNWKIFSMPPVGISRPRPNQDLTVEPSSLLLLWMNVCLCWHICAGAGKSRGLMSGWIIPPPLPLWSSANGTNCTVLSLMHWWAFSIPPLPSWVLPQKQILSLVNITTLLIQSICNKSKPSGAQWLDIGDFVFYCLLIHRYTSE